MPKRHFSPLDQALTRIDRALRTVAGRPPAKRSSPATGIAEADLDESEQKHMAGLMRINHCGEVCAQALYQGQELTARKPETAAAMSQAAEEENDHLDWCEGRLKDLNSHTSVLNPFWYAGSFTLGATAGLVGDRWSLGFVAETEHQVVRHLEDHMAQVPARDERTQAILSQMRTDEGEHATMAENQGAAKLPLPVRRLMTLTSRLMTGLAYRI